MYQQLVVLTSANRDSGTLNSCHLPFPKPLYEVKTIEVAAISIPTSGNIFNSLNNTITFSEGGGDLTATITEGSYTEALLSTEIKTRMDIAGALVYTVVVQNTPVITKRLIITATGAFSILASSANKRLGFTNTTHASIANVVTGDFPVYLAPPQYLTIHISKLGLRELIVSGSHSVPHQIIALNLGDSYNISTMFQESAFKISFDTPISSVSSVDVSITDSEFNYTLLQDWVIVLKAYSCRLC